MLLILNLLGARLSEVTMRKSEYYQTQSYGQQCHFSRKAHAKRRSWFMIA